MTDQYRTNPGPGAGKDLYDTSVLAGGKETQAVLLRNNAGAHVGFAGAPLIVDREVQTLQHSFSASEEASRVIKNSAGELLQLVVTLASGSPELFLMLFDATVLPADGAAPDLGSFPVNKFGVLEYWEKKQRSGTGRVFSTGLVAALSSTSGTLTSSGTGRFDAEYI